MIFYPIKLQELKTKVAGLEPAMMILKTIVLPFKLYLALNTHFSFYIKYILLIFYLYIFINIQWSGQDLNLHLTRYERGTLPLSYQTCIKVNTLMIGG